MAEHPEGERSTGEEFKPPSPQSSSTPIPSSSSVSRAATVTPPSEIEPSPSSDVQAPQLTTTSEFVPRSVLAVSSSRFNFISTSTISTPILSVEGWRAVPSPNTPMRAKPSTFRASACASASAHAAPAAAMSLCYSDAASASTPTSPTTTLPILFDGRFLSAKPSSSMPSLPIIQLLLDKPPIPSGLRMPKWALPVPPVEPSVFVPPTFVPPSPLTAPSVLRRSLEAIAARRKQLRKVEAEAAFNKKASVFADASADEKRSDSRSSIELEIQLPESVEYQEESDDPNWINRKTHKSVIEYAASDQYTSSDEDEEMKKEVVTMANIRKLVPRRKKTVTERQPSSTGQGAQGGNFSELEKLLLTSTKVAFSGMPSFNPLSMPGPSSAPVNETGHKLSNIRVLRPPVESESRRERFLYLNRGGGFSTVDQLKLLIPTENAKPKVAPIPMKCAQESRLPRTIPTVATASTTRTRNTRPTVSSSSFIRERPMSVSSSVEPEGNGNIDSTSESLASQSETRTNRGTTSSFQRNLVRSAELDITSTELDACQVSTSGSTTLRLFDIPSSLWDNKEEPSSSTQEGREVNNCNDSPTASGFEAEVTSTSTSSDSPKSTDATTSSPSAPVSSSLSTPPGNLQPSTPPLVEDEDDDMELEFHADNRPNGLA